MEEEDFDISQIKMPPIRSYKMVMVNPKIFSDLKSIVEEVAEGDWYSADWPMNCSICGATYEEGHYDFCLAKRTKEVLEVLK